MAVLFKPRDGSAYGLAADLAPLIVEQVIDGSTLSAVDGFFGAVVLDERNSFDVDTTLPTVIVDMREVRHDGLTYRQSAYMWMYSWSRNRVVANTVCMTLAPDGFPAVWLVLDSAEAKKQTFFVSKSFEARCVERFGSALPGRRYAAERALSDAANTRVAGLVEDGPMPLGPYVYLRANTHDIATVTCRCSPSMVEDFIDTRYYELKPRHSDGFEWRTVEPHQWPFADPWDILRWPYEPEADSAPSEPDNDED